MFTAFVSWPSAPLTNTLVNKALASLDNPPHIVHDLLECSDGLCLQWATYDEQDHERTFRHPDTVLASSYTIRKALIRKHFLHRCIHAYVTKHPESILGPRVPRTWDLEISYADELDEKWTDELWDLGKELDENPAKWWILKPGMADRGMGIRLFSSKDALQAIFEQFEDADTSEDEDDPSGNTTDVVISQLRHFVIQEYLSRPLLLDPREVSDSRPVELEGHKFHFRTYVVACGDIKVYLFRHILALFSAKPYRAPETNKTEDVDLIPHLTNTCLQAEHDERYVRRLDELIGCRVLDDSSDLGAFTSDDRDSIIEQISDTLAEVFRAAVQMPVHFQPLPNAFELYGVDFLVGHNSDDARASGRFIVKLLEFNSEPAIEMTGERLQWILEELFVEIGQTFIKPFFEEGGVIGESESFRQCLDVDVRRRDL